MRPFCRGRKRPQVVRRRFELRTGVIVANFSVVPPEANSARMASNMLGQNTADAEYEQMRVPLAPAVRPVRPVNRCPAAAQQPWITPPVEHGKRDR
jgi:hypothetical protein